MRLSTPLAALIAVVFVGGGAFAFVEWSSAKNTKRRIERQQTQEAQQAIRQARRAADTAERVGALRAASTPLVPDTLDGVELGMTLAELRDVRTVRAKRDAADRSLNFYEEMLTSNAQVVYGVDPNFDTLAQIQIMSSIPPVGVGPHLEAMVTQYGSPTGIWNCPAAGPTGLPMRRFTWRGNAVTLQDILLVHPRGVSQTLYIAPTDAIAASLRISRCVPVRSAAELSDLPAATQEQMLGALQESGAQTAF